MKLKEELLSILICSSSRSDAFNDSFSNLTFFFILLSICSILMLGDLLIGDTPNLIRQGFIVSIWMTELSGDI